jgi:hypothetical protein
LPGQGIPAAGAFIFQIAGSGYYGMPLQISRNAGELICRESNGSTAFAAGQYQVLRSRGLMVHGAVLLKLTAGRTGQLPIMIHQVLDNIQQQFIKDETICSTCPS